MNNEYNNNKQINRVATPIKLDKSGNVIDEKVEEVVIVTKTPEINSKKNKISLTTVLTVILFLILIVLIFILVRVVIPDYIKSTKVTTKYNDKKDIYKSNYLIKVYHVGEYNYLLDTNEIINSNYKIIYQNGNLLINDKLAFTSSNISSEIGLIDNLIVLINNDKKELLVYDKDAKLIHKIDKIKEDDLSITSIEYDYDKFIITTSKKNKLTNINVCKEDELYKNSISIKDSVEEKYILTYEGNNNFNEPKLNEKLSIQDYIDDICH